MEQEEGFGHPAVDAEGTITRHPERDLEPGDPKLMGAAPAEEKKGITEKVKNMMRRHGRRKKRNQDATAATGDTDPATKGRMLHKIKAKAGCKVGHGDDGSKRGPVHLLSLTSSSSSMSSSDEEDIGTVGFAMDPTGPAVAGSTLGREDFSSAPEGPGAYFGDLNLHSDDVANGDEMDQHAERAAEFAKTSNPMDFGKTLTPSEDDTHGESHRSLGTETSNSHLNPSEEDTHGGSHRSLGTETSNSHLISSEEDTHGGSHRSLGTETSNSHLISSEEDTHGGSHRSLGTQMSNSYLTPSEDAHGEQLHHSHSTETDNSNESAIDDSEPNSQGGPMVGEHHGNLRDGPGDGSLKQEGFVHKIMNKVL